MASGLFQKATQIGGAVNARGAGAFKGGGPPGTKGKQMGDRFLDLLLNGMKRLHAAVLAYWKRRTHPPGPGGNRTYTDQW